MKLMHIADLHIGKRVNEMSMLEDQIHILKEMLSIAKENEVEALLIAGDVFDKTVPSAEAVQVFDRFLTELNNLGISAYIISGNHDSQERLSFGRSLLKNANINICGNYSQCIETYSLEDEWGNVNIYLLPFLKAATVRNEFPEEEVKSTQHAVELILGRETVNTEERNILVSHQFVTAFGKLPEQSESEINPVGGLDSVDVSLFDSFDYVALGHLHGAQKMGREPVRYSGSPLKYSFSEVLHKKSVAIVELMEKGEVAVERIPLTPLRDMKILKGKLEELLTVAEEEGGSEDYILAILTDEEQVFDPMAQLRIFYPNIMKLEFENQRTILNEDAKTSATQVENKTPMQLFGEFYQMQNNVPLTKEQVEYMETIFEEEMKL